MIPRQFYYCQAELGKPTPSRPDQGKVAIFVDCSPAADTTFEVVSTVLLYIILPDVAFLGDLLK